jgi:cell division protein FtsB
MEAKTESLAKASARNKEVTFMLAWLERQYAQLDEGYQRTTTEIREVKDALGRERTVNARARADLAMLKARRTKV